MGSDPQFSFECAQDDKGFGFERTAKAKALSAGGTDGVEKRISPLRCAR